MLRSLLARLWARLFSRRRTKPEHKPSQALPREAPSAAASTYAPKAFDCSAIRTDALAFLGTELSPEQQGLVFSEAGAQAVAAGAGSGKSSTLVKRLLLMRHKLGVPLTDLTVFTFTRNSRQDFIEKLLEAAAERKVTLTAEQAQARVKTFHSKLLQLAAPVLPAGTQIFEFLGKVQKPEPGSEEEAAFLRRLEDLADEEDNPYGNETSSDQASVLREVFEEAYRTDERFRLAVTALLKHAYRDYRRQDADDEADWTRRDTAAWRDYELTQWVEGHWRQQGFWPVDGIGPAPRALAVGELAFGAHGYLPVADVFVVLSGYRLPTDEIRSNGKKFRPLWASNSKRKILLRGCSEAIFFAQTPDDFKRLKTLVQADAAIAAGRAPLFECRLPGEGGARKPVFEALYELGVFIENLGLRPSGMFGSLQSKLPGAMERQALYATSTFFRLFEDYKRDNGLQTFNDLFFRLRKGSLALKEVALSQLKSMKHLLIDEFQDISPLIVMMIDGVHGELVRRSNGTERPTLLVVGDDWQSIYGWRGSAPRFFLEFSKLFPGASSRPVMLESNYRSTQHIVSCASQLLAPIPSQYKMAKNCRAANKQFKDLPIPVYLVEVMDEKVIESVLQSMESLRAPSEEVLVVARTGKVKRTAEAVCKKLRIGNARVMTVHGSKGLQAEYVLVLEDFAYRNSNPTKNLLYAQAGFSQTYDASQHDESLRVAYVALTRAKKLCVWMGKPTDGGAMSTIRDGQACSRRVDAELLLDELAGLRGVSPFHAATG